MTTIQENAPTATDLGARWQQLRERQPGVRIRNAAQQLGVSEYRLLLAHPQAQVIRLMPEPVQLLKRIEAAGPVMALSRNNEVVHEVTSVYRNFRASSSGRQGLCLGKIDLRVFLDHWCHLCFVSEVTPQGSRESFQVFDASGQAVHKIYRTDHTIAAAWYRLRDDLVPTEPLPAPELQAPEAKATPREPDYDPQQLREDWAALRDVHHFHTLLRRHRVSRLQALRAVGEEWACPVREATFARVLQHAASHAVPIMVFVGNPGIVQIHSGPVQRIKRTGDWLNILDADFNLHANTAAICQWWQVRRPSEDGLITSLEGYNRQGELVLTLFGERKPGVAEREDWRQCLFEEAVMV